MGTKAHEAFSAKDSSGSAANAEKNERGQRRYCAPSAKGPALHTAKIPAKLEVSTSQRAEAKTTAVMKSAAAEPRGEKRFNAAGFRIALSGKTTATETMTSSTESGRRAWSPGAIPEARNSK
mmetsp:Transcript_52100/g.103467  ORF Transcript_52100/g.103467 Transcript_52100/m.103467 type:complete len:122 (+) Transcript_52100:3-368(+)